MSDIKADLARLRECSDALGRIHRTFSNHANPADGYGTAEIGSKLLVLPHSPRPGRRPAGMGRRDGAELRDRYEAAGRPVRARRLSRDLEEAAATARRHAALASFGLYLPGFDRRMAALDVRLVEPDTGVTDLTLPWLAEVLTAPDTGRDVGRPDIQEARLRPGPAVRIRQNLAAGGKSPFGTAPVVYSLIYGCGRRASTARCFSPSPGPTWNSMSR